MTTSPLQFAKDFGKLKSDLASQPAADLKLLLLIDFWPSLETHRDNKAYRSYFEEYIPLLLHLISEENLHDLTLDELEAILNVLRSLNKSGLARVGQRSAAAGAFDTNVETTGGSTYRNSQLQDKIRLTTICLAKMLFYVGCVEEGVKLCAGLVGQDGGISSKFNDLDDLSECTALRTVCERFKEKSPALYDILRSILDAWESERETLSHERANCLFVEKGGYHLSKPRVAAGLVPAGGAVGGGQAPTLRGAESSPSDAAEDEDTPSIIAEDTPSVIASDRRERGDLNRVKAGIQYTSPVIPAKGSRSEPLRFRHNAAERSRRATRGRLRVLQGRVELFGKSATTDEITFANQIVKPDDPFIGVAYDSLEAVRQVFKAEGFKDKAGAFYHAHFSIEDSSHTFTGDSIGLAVGLVTYTQLLKPEIMRQERFIAGDVAFTGGVSKEGRLTPVNKSSLACKVERAFFSPVKYLVLPEGNLEAAKQYVEKMRQRLPRRRLHLVPAERLTEVIENHNVIRAEKVCMGEFVVRKVYRYSRMTKVQVPLLAVLLLVLLAILFPKWTPWFDRNPAYAKVNIEGDCLEVYNIDDRLLWTDTVECNVSATACKQVFDLDGDGTNEVLWMPQSSENCEQRGWLYCYSHDGKPLFQRFGGILGRYPKDTVGVLYTPMGFHVAKAADKPIIITLVAQQIPARLHIRLWSATGDSLGWYINWGHGGYGFARDLDGDGREELIFMGFNNPMHCAALFALKADSCFGFSPPYKDSPEYSWLKPGNHYGYVLFPVTDVGVIDRPTKYNTPVFQGLREEMAGWIQATVAEDESQAACIIYTLDARLRVVKAVCSDTFIKRREELVAKGSLPYISWSEYQALLRDAVTYWSDSGWVSEGQLRASEKKD